MIDKNYEVELYYYYGDHDRDYLTIVYDTDIEDFVNNLSREDLAAGISTIYQMYDEYVDIANDLDLTEEDLSPSNLLDNPKLLDDLYDRLDTWTYTDFFKEEIEDFYEQDAQDSQMI